MTAMITREMVVEKLSEMFKHPTEFQIYKEWNTVEVKYRIGRIDIFRKTRILPIQEGEQCYFCNILDIPTWLPQHACEEIFRFVELMYEKRKDGYRDQEVKRMLQYVTI